MCVLLVYLLCVCVCVCVCVYVCVCVCVWCARACVYIANLISMLVKSCKIDVVKRYRILTTLTDIRNLLLNLTFALKTRV